MTESNKKSATFRLPVAQIEQLAAAADRTKDPFAPNATQIVERGIVLALAELEAKR